ANNFFAVDGHGRKLPASSASCENDVFGFNGLLAVIGSSDFYLSFCHEFSKSVDDVNLVFAHQELDTLAHFISNSSATFDHGREILFSGGLNSKILCVFDVFKYLGAF